MLVKTNCAAVYGLQAELITVEVSVQPGIRYYIVGLPDVAVRESLQRIESAVIAFNYRMPRQKIVVNLAPAYLRKEGSAFDLAIALGILAASGQLDPVALTDVLILGELSLGGELLPIQGVLTMTLRAKQAGISTVILPAANATEASLVGGIQIVGLDSLGEAIAWMKMNGSDREKFISEHRIPITHSEPSLSPGDRLDFSDVKGQASAKRALEVAAAGGHNILLCGPPGAGKSMLAQLLPTLLPPLTDEELLETTQIFSAAGQLTPERVRTRVRPFRAPHHTVSARAFAGGGISPVPGEISLAHHGVLFLDELPEFKRHVLEVLRQPLENRMITINRTIFSADYPADFILVAAMNPCPCGYFDYHTQTCICGPRLVRRYMNRISGPLLDRIDIQIDIHPVSYEELTDEKGGEPSETIRQRVMDAQGIQEQRFGDVPGRKPRNAHMDKKQLRQHAALNQDSKDLMRLAMDRLDFSARAYDRTLKIARTIADLAESAHIDTPHIAEAIQYRGLDRERWLD